MRIPFAFFRFVAAAMSGQPSISQLTSARPPSEANDVATAIDGVEERAVCGGDENRGC